MPELFRPPDQILASITRWRERQNQVNATADSVTPRQAVNMSRMARMFPYASPGVVRGLTQAGYTENDAVTQYAITQEMLRNDSTRGDYTGQIGKQRRELRFPVKSAEMTKAQRSRRLAQSMNTGFTQLARTPDALMQHAQDLMGEGETLGFFDPETQMIVEPSFSDKGSDEESKTHKMFQRLLISIFRISRQPVPYVSGEGVKAFSPGGQVPGVTQPHLDPNDTSDPFLQLAPEITLDQAQLSAPFANDVSFNPEIGSDESPAALDWAHAMQDQVYGAQKRTSDMIIKEVFNDRENKFAAIADTRKQALHSAGVFTTPFEKALRPAMIAFDAPLQEIQGQVRNIYGQITGEDVDWLESQSDLGIVLPRIIRGQEVDVGTGFFVDPESEVAKERYNREAERGKIGDHNVTIGRILANTVSEPDTKPFQLISGLTDGAAQLADPTAYGLGKAAQIQDARKVFQHEDDLLQAAGMSRGLRPHFHGPTFQQWANKNTGLIDKLTELDTAYKIGDLTNFRLEPWLNDALAQAQSGDEVRYLLNGGVEEGLILRTTDITGSRAQRTVYNWREAHRALNPQWNPRTIRAIKMMPNTKLDLNNHRQVTTQIIREMQNAHAHEDDIAAVYNNLASATTRNGLVDGIWDAHTRIGGILQSYGISEEAASSATRLYRATYNEAQRGLAIEIGTDTPPFDQIIKDGQAVTVLGPHLPLEHIGRWLYLPDQRVIRRLTTKYNFLTAKGTDIPVLSPLRIKMGKETHFPVGRVGELRLPAAAADWLMSEWLKPLWLMRLAWPIRVIGEEQLRMAAAGLDSAVKHPLSYMALVIGGDQNRLTKMVDRMTPGIKPVNMIGANGELLTETEAMKAITYRQHSSWLDTPGVIRTKNYQTYRKAQSHELSDWRRSWAHELALLHHDPVANFTANNTLDDTVEWLMNGKGRAVRRELMEAHPGEVDSIDQVRNYVQSVTERISYATSDHPDLIDIVKTGKFSKFKGGEEIVGDVFLDAPRMNPGFTVHLKGYEDVGPDEMWGAAEAATHRGEDFMEGKRAVFDAAMHLLMGETTTKLSRVPAWNQFYWRRVAEILPYADDTTRNIILSNAKKAGLTKRQIKNLQRAAGKGKRSAVDVEGTFDGKLNADDVDFLAKGHAIDDTKNLLYDLSERSEVTDIMRIMVPFGEAWKEVITRWAKLATIEGPGGLPLPGKPVRRFQQVLTGARGTDFGSFMGVSEDPITGKDRGFFYKNEFGEEVFNWPGSQFLSMAASGAPVPMTGRVQGLNMFGNILPGLGPFAQVPAAAFLQHKPEYDWWREQLLPYGAPGSEETEDIFSLREYMPAWGKGMIDWLSNGGDERTYDSSVMYMASYLYSTGEYGDSAEEQSRLMEDAFDNADDLYFVRGIGQFMLPSSPSYDWMIKDKDGRLISTRILANEFEDMKKEDYDTAIEKFIDLYGPNSIGAIIPHSRNVISNVPVSIEGASWVSKHPSVKRKFPLVYGFFAPDGGEFSMPVYSSQFLTGEREAITPREWRNLMDTTMGNYHYYRQKEKLGDDQYSPSKDQSDWLFRQSKLIREAYPNWNNSVGLEQQATTEQEVDQLYLAAKDRTVKQTNAGKGLIEYLGYRDKAQSQADSMGLRSFKSANRMAATRQWLVDHAYDIMGRYPEFEKLWVQVFAREMEDAVEIREESEEE